MVLFLFPFSLIGEANYDEYNRPFQFSVNPIAGHEKMEFEIVVNNVSSNPLSFEFPTSQYMEISVTDSSGREVYRYSKGRFFLQALQTIKIDPHQTFRKVERWNYQVNGQRIPEGQYTVTATLLPTKLNDHPIKNKQGLVSKIKINIPAQ
ncbi:BsuPI-related putative proteinase inhibitor [Neobacillus niacini]|uniref:BsuPI-related putative proteinase inhibitor n=1 Tax=Neobacillus niacini TaxID=86668 RepID=UPI0039836E52